MKTWKVTPSLPHVCLRSDNLQANSTDGQHKEAALLNKETASSHAIDAADFANNVLTNNGFGLMSSRSISDITFSYVSCVFVPPRLYIAGMESPSGPKLGKLSSSGLSRGRTPKHGHPQQQVRTMSSPENHSKHSEWRAATFCWMNTVCEFRFCWYDSSLLLDWF